MKYWTLFTLRMMARLGLLLAVILWQGSQTFEAGVFPRPGNQVIAGRVFGGGWLVFLGRTTDGTFGARYPSNKSYFYDITDYAPELHHAMYAQFDFQLKQPGQPGIEFRSRESEEYFIVFKHWLPCLTLMLATEATHWPWKKADDTNVTEANA
jgi:hypothetical protein